MLTYLTHLGITIGPWLYLVAAALVFGESALLVGVVLPGETALLVSGYFVQHGVLNLPTMVAVAVASAIVGDAVGFLMGRRYGQRLRGSGLGRRIGSRRWQQVDQLLVRRGGPAVLVGRLTALLRALTPFTAGASPMSWRTFMTWNAFGGLIWGGGCVTLGWLFAAALAQVGHVLTWAPLAVIALAFVVVIIHRVTRVTSPGAGSLPG